LQPALTAGVEMQKRTKKKTCYYGICVYSDMIITSEDDAALFSDAVT